ncbi:unnamed protein product [Rotaria sp. Silwood2]|nr:unnamed protein product [Rotaria sp. Silwood2]
MGNFHHIIYESSNDHSSRDHPHSSLGMTVLIHETDALRQHNSNLCEQLKLHQIQIQRQQIHFDQQLQKALSALPTTHNELTDHINDSKEEINNLKQENNDLKQEYRRLQTRK